MARVLIWILRSLQTLYRFSLTRSWIQSTSLMGSLMECWAEGTRSNRGLLERRGNRQWGNKGWHWRKKTHVLILILHTFYSSFLLGPHQRENHRVCISVCWLCYRFWSCTGWSDLPSQHNIRNTDRLQQDHGQPRQGSNPDYESNAGSDRKVIRRLLLLGPWWKPFEK